MTAIAMPTAYRYRWVVLAIVLCAEVMDLLDGTITNIAAPSIRADLGGSASSLQWLGAAYALPFAVFLITGARLGDRYGRRKLFVIGAAGFTVASVLCASAQSMEMLIVLRAFQGGFGALLIPQGFGILKDVFEDDEQQKAFASFGPVMGLSAMAGPIVAGVLIDSSDWRTIFLINLPVGIAAVAGALKYMPDLAPTRSTKLDPGGITLLSIASVAVIYPLVEGRDQGWPLWIFAMFAAGVAGLGAFALYERRHRESALIEPTLLRNSLFVNGLAVATSFFAAMIGMMLVTSLFFQLGLRLSPLDAALALAPLPLGIGFTAPASFALTPKFGRKVVQAGIVLNAIGLAGMAAAVAHFGHDTTAWELVPGGFVAGLGMGLVLAPLFDFVLAGVADQEVGSASGVLNAVQQFAGAAGLAVVGTVFFAYLDNHVAFTTAMTRTTLITIVPLAIAFALSFRLPKHPREEAAMA